LSPPVIAGSSLKKDSILDDFVFTTCLHRPQSRSLTILQVDAKRAAFSIIKSGEIFSSESEFAVARVQLLKLNPKWSFSLPNFAALVHPRFFSQLPQRKSCAFFFPLSLSAEHVYWASTSGLLGSVL
jgi:hypothetical protein